MNRRKKVLIIGCSAKEYSLVKKIKNYDCDIYAAPGNFAIQELVQIVDIREDNAQELLEFVLENGIDLTIASSEVAIKNDIAGLFQANGQMIFAPSTQSSSFALSRSAGKRFLYKLRIPTPKFAIFDKLCLKSLKLFLFFQNQFYAPQSENKQSFSKFPAVLRF